MIPFRLKNQALAATDSFCSKCRATLRLLTLRRGSTPRELGGSGLDRIIGDERTFTEARFDLISVETAAELSSRGFAWDDRSYALIADPTLDDVARSLTDTANVLPEESR